MGRVSSNASIPGLVGKISADPNDLPSIVTMAVSAAILETFSVKEWPDLEIWVWDPSRSLRMAPFDRPHMTLLVSHCNYSSIPFASYLMFNNTVTLKYGLEVTQGH